MIATPPTSTPTNTIRTRRTRATAATKDSPPAERPEPNKASPTNSPKSPEKELQPSSAPQGQAGSGDSALTPLEELPLKTQFKRLLPHASVAQLKEDEVDAILDEIVKHCEKVDRYQKWGKNIDTDGLPTMGADPGLKNRALPVLANLTTQILHIFATYSYLDLVTVVAEPESEAGKVAVLLKF